MLSGEKIQSLPNPIARSLEKLASRIIFDAEATENIPAFAKAALRHHEETGVDIADLSWARTENWRQLMADIFRGKERVEQLRNLKKLQITYNALTSPSFCHTKIQALYLHGWLAALMDWKSPPDVVLLEGQNKDLTPGAILAVDMLTSNGEHFAFVRTPDHPHQIQMTLSTPDRCEIPSKFIFSKTQSGFSLVSEIGKSGTSPHFLKLMEAFCS